MICPELSVIKYDYIVSCLLTAGMANEGAVVMGNKQHLTMYISFGLVSLIAILVHHKVKFVPQGESGFSVYCLGSEATSGTLRRLHLTQVLH